MKLSNLYIYKLAVIANMKLQSLSSCEMCVSVYSGWLAYSTFDHEWVKHELKCLHYKVSSKTIHLNST